MLYSVSASASKRQYHARCASEKISPSQHSMGAPFARGSRHCTPAKQLPCATSVGGTGGSGTSSSVRYQRLLAERRPGSMSVHGV